MRRRDLPEINAGSMADIAFLLLIFFLVATTMDTDTGILKILSQPPPANYDPPEVKERNILVVLVNRDDQLMVEGEICDIENLKERTKEFLLNVTDRDDLPEKRTEIIDLLGETKVTKGIISLQTDRGTSYEMFVAVMNELMAAGNEIKEDLSRIHFGESFADLPKEKRQAVQDAVPCIISEAEPRNVGK